MRVPVLVRGILAALGGVAVVACGSSNPVDAGHSSSQQSGAGGSGGTTPSTAGASTISSGGTTPGAVASGGARAPSGGSPGSTATGGAPGATGGATTLGNGGSTSPPGSGGTTTLGNGGSTSPGTAGSTSTKPPSGTPTLVFLDAAFGRVLRAGVDGSASRAIVTTGSSTPDGVAVDVANGFVYWTNMGVPNANDGFVLRTKLDGSGETAIVPKGSTFTPKQIKLDADHGMLYWADREGMKIQRAKTDGSGLETLVTIADGDTARADASNWAVGIALDLTRGQMYWTQKGPTNGGKGSIRRATIEVPAGQDAAHRTDIEVLFSGLPEPIDLDVDPTKRQIYWTDRGDNTVSRAPMDPPAGFDPAHRTDRDILVHGAGQAIGISLDLGRGTMYYTSLDTGTVWKAALDGTGAKGLLMNQGSLTGIVVADLP